MQQIDLETVKGNCQSALESSSFWEKKRAFGDFDTLIQQNPNRGELYYWKGYYYLVLGLHNVDWQIVVSWFDLALKYGYETTDVHYYKSMMLAYANQDSHALDCLNRVLKMAPHHAGALNDKGRILMWNLQHDDA